MPVIYLDNAATTKVRKEVVDLMSEVLLNTYGNASSSHSYGRTSKALLEKCRKEIAGYFNVSAAEIIFTSGGTEADNLILQSAVRDLNIQHIITSKVEHHAVLHTAEFIQNQYGVKLSFVDLDDNGQIDYDHLSVLLDTELKTLVSLMHINNEIGTILNLNLVSKLCQEKNALFHSDTVQSVGHFPLDLSKIKLDFITASAHKFHGPKGIGFAFIRKQSGLNPLIIGGSQERGYRAGTESIHDICGMHKALELAYDNLDKESDYISSLKTYFIKNLKANIPNIKFNGLSADLSQSTYTLVNVCLPISLDRAAMLLFQLDIKGISCSKGSACQSGSSKGSHVLQEILSEEDLHKPSIRFSFSMYNTKEELDYVVASLADLINS